MRYPKMIRSLCVLLSLLVCCGCLLQRSAAEEDPIARFQDIRPNAWYTASVREAVRMGLFSGETESCFGVKHGMSRGMLVTSLWQMAGKPAAESPIPFRDVKDSAYYAEAVRWAADCGIVSGVGEGLFAPRSLVTREQLAVTLRAYAAWAGFETDSQSSLEPYPDLKSVSGYARKALAWAVAEGLISGCDQKGIVYLLPKKSSTRAETAVILMNFYRRILCGETVPQPTQPEAPTPERQYRIVAEGHTLHGQPFWNDRLYCGLPELSLAGEGSFKAGANLALEAFGHRLYLSRRGDAVLIDGVRRELGSSCVYYGGSWFAPAEPLLALLGMDMLDDPERQQCYFSHIPHSAAIPTGSSVVLLRYHCVSDEIWGVKDLFMSPEKLEAQIELMEELGCSFLNFEDLDRIDQYEKPVFLTFDDGYDDNYTELYPILKRHNAKATIFVITGMIGNNYHMTEEMMREMDASGLVSFQSHTVSHANMNIASPEEREYEAFESQLTLARLLGKIPFALSFPKARANAEAMACVARYYDYVVIADGEPWVTGSDPLHIPRFAMPRDITTETFRGYFDCFHTELP